MEKSLEINVISARGIKNVNLISKMDAYAVVSITEGDYYHNKKGKKLQKAKTPVDRDGGTNPTWNYPLKFTIQEPLPQQKRLNLVFKLKCEGAFGDKDIGEVNVPVKELLEEFFSGGKQGDRDNGEQGRAMKFVTYQVRKPSGKPEGELNFSYRVADVSSSSTLSGKYEQKVDQPVTAYPAPVAGPSAISGTPYPYYQQPPPPAEYNYGYPPPPQTYYSGYPPPPPPPPLAGYGYPPPPYGYPPAAGYGYPPPPVQQPPPRRNNFGMGLGAGLLGGVLGGLLIGDLVSDACAYDAGYDAGFGDAGGF